MDPLQLVRKVLGGRLPVRHGDMELQVNLAGASLEDGGLVSPVRVVLYEEADSGSIQNIFEQTLPLVQARDLGEPTERVRAYLEGWLSVLPELLARAREESGEDAMPYECLCPAALHAVSTAVTKADFEMVLRRDKSMWDEWKKAFTGPQVPELDDGTYAAFLAAEQPEAPEERETRRQRALEEAELAFVEVAAKVREVLGLQLPLTAKVFDAFWRSLSRAELEAYERLALPTPAAVMEYFAPGGLERRVRDGLDARLLWRYRHDPPELVTALWGHGGDGQHFGFFYDDPAKLPAGVVVNYARDSQETWWSAPTLLGVVREQLNRIAQQRLTEEGFYEDVGRAACQHRLLAEAVAALARAEEDAARADAARLPMAYEDRTRLPQIVCGVGVFVPGVTRKPAHMEETWGFSKVFSSDLPRVRRLITEARAALDRGEPLDALALGRDLHWADVDELRAETLELLTRAYRALGREALARVAEVHYSHRDLPNVAVFEDG